MACVTFRSRKKSCSNTRSSSSKNGRRRSNKECAANGQHASRRPLLSLSAEQKRLVPITWQAEQLADAYIKAGIVGEQWRGDCLHVAAATISHADAIVSWNFKHIVNLGKMKAYNEVNIREGYSMLTVLSPKEVNFDDTE